MTPLRALQIGLAALLLAGAPWLVRALDTPTAAAPGSGGWLSGGPALAVPLAQGDNNGDNNGDNDGDNGGGDNFDNSDNDGGDNDGANDDNDVDDNDNFDIDIPPPPPLAPARPPEPVCSTPGQETVFTSPDGKLAVRVFPTMPRPVRIEVYQVIDFLSAPLPPGNIVGLLAYEIRASYCDATPLAELPSEVNVGIHYTDIDAIGLDESRFVIGRLDVPTGTWVPVEKQANDPPANYISMTSTLTGFYMVWEQR